MRTIVIMLTFFARLFRALWLFIASVISVIAIYYLLIGVEQGIDVVIQAGEIPGRGIFAIVTVTLWAYLVWYSSRRLSYIRQNKDDTIYNGTKYSNYGIATYFHQHIPRLLAYNCFVCVQVAIFHLPTLYGISAPGVALMILAHNALYVLLHVVFISVTGNRWAIAISLSVIVVSSYGGLLIYGMFSSGIEMNMNVFGDEPGRHTFWLRLMAFFLFGLQIFSVFFFIRRRQDVDSRVMSQPYSKHEMASTEKQSEFLKWMKHPVFDAPERGYFIIFNIISAAAGLIYLTAVFDMGTANFLGPLAFSLLAIGILTGLANIVTAGSIKVSFNLFFVLCAVAFINGFWLPNPYKVRLAKSNQALFADRPTHQEYLERWFTRRIEKVEDDTTKFPVYIVLSNGGASRAGKWTTSVLTRIQDESFRLDSTDSFKDHILAIAGASGGSVGNCAFYSLLKTDHDNLPGFDSRNYFQYTERFFNSDFLTYTLARYLGPDMIRHVFPIGMDDRAAALERTLTHSKDSLLNYFFSQSVDTVFDYSGSLPILYITTTQVDNGMPGVISSVKLTKGDSQREDVLSLVDKMAAEGEGDIRLNTAAILSSRFPYVSPAGKVYDRYYVDGGYFDNSGAGMVLELIRELGIFFNRPEFSHLRDEFSFHIIHITNSEVHQRPVEDIHPLMNDLFAPLLTLAGMQGSSTNISNGVLQSNFLIFTSDNRNTFIEYSLYDENYDGGEDHDKYEEGYPMSWVISEYQQNRMRRALDVAYERNRGRLYFADK